MNEYSITIRSDSPPRAYIGDNVLGGKIVSIASSDPATVNLSWLSNRYGMSRDTIRQKLEQINIGTAGKCVYDREKACQLLENSKPKKRGRKRIN